MYQLCLNQAACPLSCAPHLHPDFPPDLVVKISAFTFKYTSLSHRSSLNILPSSKWIFSLFLSSNLLRGFAPHKPSAISRTSTPGAGSSASMCRGSARRSTMLRSTPMWPSSPTPLGRWFEMPFVVYPSVFIGLLLPFAAIFCCFCSKTPSKRFFVWICSNTPRPVRINSAGAQHSGKHHCGSLRRMQA